MTAHSLIMCLDLTKSKVHSLVELKPTTESFKFIMRLINQDTDRGSKHVLARVAMIEYCFRLVFSILHCIAPIIINEISPPSIIKLINQNFELQKVKIKILNWEKLSQIVITCVFSLIHHFINTLKTKSSGEFN